jgi:hypothetical protein
MFSDVLGSSGCKRVLPSPLFREAVLLVKFKEEMFRNLTPWNRFLPQKLIGPQEVMKFHEL